MSLIREKLGFFFKYCTRHLHSNDLHGNTQQHGVNSDGRLPNHYTHAKFKNVLPITSKDIHNFINIIYYS